MDFKMTIARVGLLLAVLAIWQFFWMRGLRGRRPDHCLQPVVREKRYP